MSKEAGIPLGMVPQKEDEAILDTEKEDTEVDVVGEDPHLSTAKIVVLAAGMMMTFFIGVSTFDFVQYPVALVR